MIDDCSLKANFNLYAKCNHFAFSLQRRDEYKFAVKQQLKTSQLSK